VCRHAGGSGVEEVVDGIGMSSQRNDEKGGDQERKKVLRMVK